MTFGISPQKFLIYSFLIIAITLVFLSDFVLFSGMMFLMLIFAFTFLLVKRKWPNNKYILWLLLIVFFSRLFVVIFIHYFNFQPFSRGEGDYILYDNQARQISQNFEQGFSLDKLTIDYWWQQGINVGHYYPIIMGFIYFISSADMIAGQLFNVWLAVLTCLIIYFLTIEIGGSQRAGFIAGIIACIYPSYVFYGSLLLKDTIFAPIILLAILLGIKLLKNFRWWLFSIFYFILLAATHFRFYVAYALIFAFVICWFSFAKIKIKKRISIGIFIFIILGSVPGFLGFGYYGFSTIKQYINPNMIAFYREIAYAPFVSSNNATQSEQEPGVRPVNFFEKILTTIAPREGGGFSEGEPQGGTGSSIATESIDVYNPIKSLWIISKSFVYVVLGPLPWQVKSLKQTFVFAETIPWYVLIYFIAKGFVKSVKRDKSVFLPMIFSILVFGVLSLFLSNFGIVTRIRIPAFLALFCFAPFGFENIKLFQKWTTKK